MTRHKKENTGKSRQETIEENPHRTPTQNRQESIEIISPPRANRHVSVETISPQQISARNRQESVEETGRPRFLLRVPEMYYNRPPDQNRQESVEEARPHGYLPTPQHDRTSYHTSQESWYPSRSRMVLNLRSNYRRSRENSPNAIRYSREMSPIRSDTRRTMFEGDRRLIFTFLNFNDFFFFIF
jgi:hypothetical protein